MVSFAVAASSVSHTRIDVSVRQFDFILDEPTVLGGTDEGPSPAELLLASLLGYLNAMVRRLAQERGVAVHDVELMAEGDLDLAWFFGVDAGLSGIRVHIELESNANAAMIDEIEAELGLRCPAIADIRVSALNPISLAADEEALLAA
jgi:uncharacterized OsmC-like protein